MGPEKRKHKRHPKRLNVRYGEKEPLDRTAFIGDVSAGGMFVVAKQLPTIGARLHFQVFLDAQKFVFFEGVVARHKTVPPGLQAQERGGFGVRFLTPAEVASEVVPAAAQQNKGLEVAFASQADFKAAYERELRYGGIFVKTDRPLMRDANTTVELHLLYVHKSFELACKVIQVKAAEVAGGPGVILAFADIGQAKQLLAPFAN
jgi:Tfp pilus assembly protein PilZ